MQELIQSLSKITITQFAAWWGAIIATLVLIWDIYKWKKRGAKIVIKARPNMVGVPSDDKTYIVVIVTNRGDLPTTITHLVGLYYPSIFSKFLHRKINFFFPYPGPTPPPYTLQPGNEWKGLIDQDNLKQDLLVQGRKKGFLYCGVVHSSSNKPMLKRVNIWESQREKNV